MVGRRGPRGIGFFEQRGDKVSPAYWVPFLYQPALELVQGSADPGLADPDDDSDEEESDPGDLAEDGAEGTARRPGGAPV